MLRATRLRRGEGAVGQMAVTREPLQIPDIAAAGAYEGRLRGALLEAGTRAVLAIPLLHEDRIVGGLVVTRRTPGAFSGAVVEILRTFANPVRPRHPERAAVPRDREQESPARLTLARAPDSRRRPS